MSRRYKVQSFTGVEKGAKNEGPENHNFGVDGYRMVVEDAVVKAPVCTVCCFTRFSMSFAHVGVLRGCCQDTGRSQPHLVPYVAEPGWPHGSRPPHF